MALTFALFQNAVDFARVFVPASPSRGPAPITFYFQNRHDEQSFSLLDENGAAREEVLRAFSHFVRCWRTEREKPMHPRLIEIVAAVSHHFSDARIEVVSGYRARPFGAPHSKHFLGRAMDVHIQGVPAKKVADWVWQNFRHVGVGYYPKQDFMHVDVRDLDVRWVDTSRHGESAHAKYTGRRPGEEALPEGAPQLAYDQPQAAPSVSAMASAELPWPSSN
jgi:uncharacterized protein YcbK (DUF882 family)